MTQAIVGSVARYALNEPSIPSFPKITVRYITHKAINDGNKIATPLRWSQVPIKTAIGTCTMQGKIAEGYIRKTAAMTNPKIASTTVNPKKRTSKKSQT